MVEHFGYFASTYGLALSHVLGEHSSLLIIGNDQTASEMLRVAQNLWSADSSVVHVSGVAQLQQLPTALRETVAPLAQGDRTVALLCTGNVCRPPMFDAEALKAELAVSAKPEHVHQP